MMFPYGRWAPSPPAGEGWGGGSCGDVTAVPTLATPTPNPSPPGGGELHHPHGATYPGRRTAAGLPQ